MSEKVLCPYCGAEMKISGVCKLVYFHCVECGSISPNIHIDEGCCVEEAKHIARAAALRRYTPPLRPMTLEEVESTIFCVPCWIECPHEYPFPEALDKDSVGWFGKINAAKNNATEYFKSKDYGKEWRCWERRPTEEEMEAAEWEK